MVFLRVYVYGPVSRGVLNIVAFSVLFSLWIRYASVGFIAAVARSLSGIDLHCMLLPMLKPYLKRSATMVGNEDLLFESLLPCIPRPVYEHIACAHNLDEYVYGVQWVSFCKGFTLGAVPPHLLSHLHLLFWRFAP